MSFDWKLQIVFSASSMANHGATYPTMPGNTANTSSPSPDVPTPSTLARHQQRTRMNAMIACPKREFHRDPLLVAFVRLDVETATGKTTAHALPTLPLIATTITVRSRGLAGDKPIPKPLCVQL